MGNDDKSTVRLPVAVFIAMLGAATLGGGSAGSYIKDRNTDKLPELEDNMRILRQSLEDVRATADAALSLAAQNGARVNDNRQTIFDSTRKRWSAIDHDKYAREVDSRFLQVERRVSSIERDIDKLED